MGFNLNLIVGEVPIYRAFADLHTGEFVGGRERWGGVFVLSRCGYWGRIGDGSGIGESLRLVCPDLVAGGETAPVNIDGCRVEARCCMVVVEPLNPRLKGYRHAGLEEPRGQRA